MQALKRWYLTGLEAVSERTLSQKEPNTLLTLEDNANTILAQGQRLVLRQLGQQHGPDVRLLPIPPQGVSGKKFTLLTDQTLDKQGNIEVLFCSVFPLNNGRSAIFSMNLDFSGGTVGSTRLACKSAAEDVIYLPSSTPTSQNPYDRVPPFSYLQYDLENLAEHQFVAVVDKANVPTPGFLVAEFSDSSDAMIRAKVGLGSLLSAGLKMRLPANRPMLTEVQIPALHSSLLNYKLKITRHPQRDELFAPLLRQSIPDPHESKFFVNVNDVNVNLHGVAPFMPSPVRESAAAGGVSFQLWTDPSPGETVDISLKIDITGSLGELVMRYRTVFAAFPLLVVALVLRKQFQVYDETGYFIPFTDGLDRALRSSLPLLLVGMSLLASSLATTKALPQSDDPFHWRTNSTETPLDFTKNDLLLGSQDAFFWFLVPIFGLISVGVCVLVNYVALFLVNVFSLAYGAINSKSGYIRREDRGNLPIFSAPTPRRRVIHTAILLLLVSTIIPYQFAYMVACIVQLATTVRSQWHAKETVRSVPSIPTSKGQTLSNTLAEINLPPQLQQLRPLHTNSDALDPPNKRARPTRLGTQPSRTLVHAFLLAPQRPLHHALPSPCRDHDLRRHDPPHHHPLPPRNLHALLRYCHVLRRLRRHLRLLAAPPGQHTGGMVCRHLPGRQWILPAEVMADYRW
jgi:hypothetical protein